MAHPQHIRAKTSDIRNVAETQGPEYDNGGRLGGFAQAARAMPRDHSLLSALAQLSSIVDDGHKQVAELTELVDRLCKDVVGESEDREEAVPERPSFSPLDGRLLCLGELFRQRQAQIDRLRRALGI